MSARERVRGRVSLTGRMSVLDDPDPPGTARLLVRTGAVSVWDGVDAGPPHRVPLPEYRLGEPDPLHTGAAEQLQHLAAHHPEAITVLTRLCEREALIGVTRVLPIALDRYGIVLRVERLRGHRDIRLPFAHRVDSGAEAATQLRHLLAQGHRRRPCGR